MKTGWWLSEPVASLVTHGGKVHHVFNCRKLGSVAFTVTYRAKRHLLVWRTTSCGCRRRVRMNSYKSSIYKLVLLKLKKIWTWKQKQQYFKQPLHHITWLHQTKKIGKSSPLYNRTDSYQEHRSILFTGGEESGVNAIVNLHGPWMIDAAHQPAIYGKKTLMACALKAALISSIRLS